MKTETRVSPPGLELEKVWEMKSRHEEVWARSMVNILGEAELCLIHCSERCMCLTPLGKAAQPRPQLPRESLEIASPGGL